MNLPITVARRSILFCLALSCLVEVSAADDIRLLQDVPYKPNAGTDYEQQRCKLDLYLPADAEGFATIVWFHGGGLQNGDKAGDIAVAFGHRFAKAGIAVASVNYRLHPQVRFPAYVEDAAAAVAFVHRAIREYGGSPNRVFVSGHSAGGYLASMVGLDGRYLGAQSLQLRDLAGLIPISGQMVTHSTVRAERDIPSSRPIIDEAAPAYFVQQDASPFLVVAGGEDLPARAEESRYFVAAMKAAGHDDVIYLEVAGRTHTTIASRIGDPDDVVADAVIKFIERRYR